MVIWTMSPIVISLPTGKYAWTLKRDSRGRMILCFSALVATACYDTRVLLWSTITGELIRELLHQFPRPLAIYAGGENDSFVRSVLFTRFDQHLISACDDQYVRTLPVLTNASVVTFSLVNCAGFLRSESVGLKQCAIGCKAICFVSP